MSGAYGNRFLGRRFAWEAERRVRKIFMDDDQAASYHDEHDRAAKARFLAASPLWEAALPPDLPPYDPFLEPVKIDVSWDGEWREVLELTTTPSDALRAALRDVAKGVRGKDVADFKNPVAEVRWGARAGLYVGVRMEARADVEAALRPRLRETLDALWPVVEERTSTWPRIQAPEDATRAFNPWGPLSDESFMREKWSVASVTAIVAFKDRGERYSLEEWFKGRL